ncbi:MAG: GNAT family N-acetyltransferase [Gaiellaceae bacterium]
MDVRPIPGLEHLPFAEVWFHAIDEESWREASAAARAIGKPGIEAWTTGATPEVAAFLERRGFEQVRHYAISELDVAAAPDPDPPSIPLTTFALRPDLAGQLYEIAREAYPDQPGREETRLPALEGWRSWGLDPHPPDACFVAVEAGRALGYGYLELDGEAGRHGFTGVRREARGRGIAGAIKRAQIAWAKREGLRMLRTANELRLPQMLALNQRLGYRPLSTEIVLRGPVA